jgi:hypothetical protein
MPILELKFRLCHRISRVVDFKLSKRLERFSLSRRREAPCEVTNSPRLFTPGETKALAKFKVHQLSRAWVTNDGWSSSLISKIWRTVMNSGHWLVLFKVWIITTAWRQRNSKHLKCFHFQKTKFPSNRSKFPYFWKNFLAIKNIEFYLI